jgi:hypothetical protein
MEKLRITGKCSSRNFKWITSILKYLYGYPLVGLQLMLNAVAVGAECRKD